MDLIGLILFKLKGSVVFCWFFFFSLFFFSSLLMSRRAFSKLAVRIIRNK